MRTTFPGWTFKIEDMIAKGNQVVVYWTATGTHGKEHRGVPPTGKPFTVDGYSLYLLCEGKILGRRSVWDRLGLFEQGGAFP